MAEIYLAKWNIDKQHRKYLIYNSKVQFCVRKKQKYLST